MTIKYNELFKQLLEEYHLPEDFSFSIDLPNEVQKILKDKILLTENGITLKSFNRLYKATQDWENQSIIEDNENHFHVNWYLEENDNKLAFMLVQINFRKKKLKALDFGIHFKHLN